MRISAKTQLALFFLGIICLIGVASALIANWVVTQHIIQEAQMRVKEDLNTARFVYQSRLRELDRTIHWTAIRHVLKEGIKRRNVLAVEREMAELMAEEKIDFLTLVDRNGSVVFRFHHPQAFGDSLLGDPFVRSALSQKGMAGTQVLSREELLREGEALAQRAAIRLIPTPKEKVSDKTEETSGMVLKSAHPVLDFNGELLGALIGGVLLNRNYEIVDLIKNLVYKDARYQGKDIGTATLFMGDLRISTNVLDREGNRAVGTRAMKEVYGQVVEKGQPWIQRAFVVDDWYITAYEPIEDINGKNIGMLYVGILERKYAAIKERIVLLFLLFSMSGMLLALAVSFFLWQKVLKR